MTKSRGILRPRHDWTLDEVVLLVQRYPNEPCKAVAKALRLPADIVYKKARSLDLKKTDAFWDRQRSQASLNARFNERMIATRFKPGSVPQTKGMKGIHLSPHTEFRPGSIPPNRQEVGALRINSMGDLDIKVAPGPRQWVSMRLYVWEQAYGPVPPGMLICVRNHDPHDTQLHNLFLATRAENIAHNLHVRYPKELRCTMQLAGRIRNRIAKHLEAQHA